MRRLATEPHIFSHVSLLQLSNQRLGTSSKHLARPFHVQVAIVQLLLQNFWQHFLVTALDPLSCAILLRRKGRGQLLELIDIEVASVEDVFEVVSQGRELLELLWLRRFALSRSAFFLGILCHLRILTVIEVLHRWRGRLELRLLLVLQRESWILQLLIEAQTKL